MPLRVTVELIPRGDESRKRKVAVVDITNDGTGTHEVGNYDVRAEGDCQGGYDTFYHGKVAGLKRGDYLDTSIDCLRVLHTSNASLDRPAASAGTVGGLVGRGWVWLKCADCGCTWKSCQDSDACPECPSPHGHDIIDGDDCPDTSNAGAVAPPPQMPDSTSDVPGGCPPASC